MTGSDEGTKRHRGACHLLDQHAHRWAGLCGPLGRHPILDRHAKAWAVRCIGPMLAISPCHLPLLDADWPAAYPRRRSNRRTFGRQTHQEGGALPHVRSFEFALCRWVSGQGQEELARCVKPSWPARRSTRNSAVRYTQPPACEPVPSLYTDRARS
jgi:hypothetical protein